MPAGVVYAFAKPSSACGVWTACAGPIWQTSGTASGGVVVAGGKLYADGYAYDAAGATGCAGTPVVCQPLFRVTSWPGTASCPAAVACEPAALPAAGDGHVFVPTAAGLRVYDANGSAGCTASPVACQPLWTTSTGDDLRWSSPVVANGVVYVGTTDGRLLAYDAAGAQGCAGTPVVCAPIWSITVKAGAPVGSPIVSNGWLYVTTVEANPSPFQQYPSQAIQTLYAFAP